MKIKDFKAFLGELIDEENDLTKTIENEAVRLAKSGGIDLESYGDDFLAPKICLYVALLHTAEQFYPFSADSKKVADNLAKY